MCCRIDGRMFLMLLHSISLAQADNICVCVGVYLVCAWAFPCCARQVGMGKEKKELKSGKDKETAKDKEDRKGGGMAKAEVSVRACTSAHSKIL